MLPVLSVQMPVLRATDIVVTKLMALDEHYCDFSRMLPVARALREQVDWAQVRREVADNDFAVVFLQLLERLRVLPEVSGGVTIATRAATAARTTAAVAAASRRAPRSPDPRRGHGAPAGTGPAPARPARPAPASAATPATTSSIGCSLSIAR